MVSKVQNNDQSVYNASFPDRYSCSNLFNNVVLIVAKEK